jgi:hypothetical protein
MTARELIAQWFERPQMGVASNERYITIAQLDLLRDLIGQDEESGALRKGMGRSFTWMPRGRDKWVISEWMGGKRNTILRLSNIVPSESGMLF